MSRRVLILAIVVAIVGVGAQSEAHVGSHEVGVRDNFYDPQVLAIDKGETVTWRAVNAGHTVTADDGSFDLPSSGTFAIGDSANWSAPDRDVTIKYRCRVHSSMVGVIKVGLGTRIDPPPPAPFEVRSVPSSRYPTIASATTGLTQRVRIEIAPGTYPESIVLAAVGLSDPAIHLIGLGDEPGDVVIDGGGTRNSGIGALVDGVRIANLRVRGFTSTGVLVRDTKRFSIENVEAFDNGQYGIRTLRAVDGRISDVVATGASRAAIAVQSCSFCDIVVENVRADDNLVGLAALDAGALVVRNSRFDSNAVGIGIKTSADNSAAPRGVTHVFRNTITDTRSDAFPGAPETLDLPVHAGIWVDAGRFTTIESNTILGNAWGVVLTGFAGPAIANRVRANVLDDADQAHLAWDGYGAATCFSDNSSRDADGLETQPPALQELQPCSRNGVGTPYPIVDAMLLAG